MQTLIKYYCNIHDTKSTIILMCRG